MSEPSTRIIEETTARAIVVCGSTVLVMYFPPKQICFFPGGRLESGETIREALERELSEELPGHHFEVTRYFGSITHRWKDRDGARISRHHFHEVTAATLSSTSVPPMVEPPLEFRWIPLDALERSNVQPRLACRLLRTALAGSTEPWNGEEGDWE